MYNEDTDNNKDNTEKEPKKEFSSVEKSLAPVSDLDPIFLEDYRNEAKQKAIDLSERLDHMFIFYTEKIQDISEEILTCKLENNEDELKKLNKEHEYAMRDFKAIAFIKGLHNLAEDEFNVQAFLNVFFTLLDNKDKNILQVTQYCSSFLGQLIGFSVIIQGVLAGALDFEDINDESMDKKVKLWSERFTYIINKHLKEQVEDVE